MNRTANIRGYTWKAVKIVLDTAREGRWPQSQEDLDQLNDAMKRVEQMLKEEPERFMEV